MTATDPLIAIGQTVQLYFEGMHRGDTQRLRQAFRPDACLDGYYQGEYARLSLDEWLAEVEGLPKPSEQGEPFDMCIVAIDVSGRIAAVKVVVLYLGLRFTDYLSLVQFEASWRIVHKAYRHD